MISEPSENLCNRNGVESTQGDCPVIRSAASNPAPVPKPNPWPENPVAMRSENGGEKVVHGSSGMSLLRAA